MNIDLEASNHSIFHPGTQRVAFKASEDQSRFILMIWVSAFWMKFTSKVFDSCHVVATWLIVATGHGEYSLTVTPEALSIVLFIQR
jgi:hypothetical protein